MMILGISLHKIIQAACLAAYVTALYYTGKHDYKAYKKYQKGGKQ